MSIGRPILILYFLVRKITAEGAEERRAFNHLFPLLAPLRTRRLSSLFGCSILHVPGSSCIVKFPDSGFRYLGSYEIFSKNASPVVSCCVFPCYTFASTLNLAIPCRASIERSPVQPRDSPGTVRLNSPRLDSDTRNAGSDNSRDMIKHTQFA